MIEPVAFPDVEALLVRVLGPLVGAPVSTRIPEPRPETFVRVMRVGGTKTNVITDSPMVVIECWGSSSVEAGDLARRTRAYVFALAQTMHNGDYVRAVSEVGGPQNFPDPLSGAPRYQFTVQLDTRGVPL